MIRGVGRRYAHLYPTPTIRTETDDDISGVRVVVRAAFAGSAEADLVDSLRRAGALTLSAVAVVGSRVVGHVGLGAVTRAAGILGGCWRGEVTAGGRVVDLGQE